MHCIVRQLFSEIERELNKRMDSKVRGGNIWGSEKDWMYNCTQWWKKNVSIATHGAMELNVHCKKKYTLCYTCSYTCTMWWAKRNITEHYIDVQHGDGQKEILLNITWMYNMVMGRKKYFRTLHGCTTWWWAERYNSEHYMDVQHGDGQKEMLLGSAPPTRHHDSTFQQLRSACWSFTWSFVIIIQKSMIYDYLWP